MNSPQKIQQKWVVGVSGASGMSYALRLLDFLADNIYEIHLVFSDAALRVLAEEEGIKFSPSSNSTRALIGRDCSNVTIYNNRDIGAAIASGSFVSDGMVIVPCSMNTLAAVAGGISSNLLQRAADVTIKENRKLVLVPRETPLSTIHLQNMLTLSRCGAVVCAAMPGFYHKPSKISDLVDMLVAKILDQMGIPNHLIERWGQERAAAPGKKTAAGIKSVMNFK